MLLIARMVDMFVEDVEKACPSLMKRSGNGQVGGKAGKSLMCVLNVRWSG